MPKLCCLIADVLEISLDKVRSIVKKMSKRELPGITPFRVHEHFINSFVRKWEHICLDAFYEVEKILKIVVEAMYTKYFGRFQSSGLLYDVRYPSISKLMLTHKCRHKRHAGESSGEDSRGNKVIL